MPENGIFFIRQAEDLKAEKEWHLKMYFFQACCAKYTNNDMKDDIIEK